MIDPKFLDQLATFHLVINKRVTSTYTGTRLSTTRGRGLILKDYRIYVPGDDIRTVDWKVYARTDKLHVRTYEEERAMTVHIILDASASMQYGEGITKFDYAGMLGTGIAYIAFRKNEKFQYCTFADSLETFRPRRGMHQLASMIDHLNSVKPEGVSRLRDAVAQYVKFIRTKSFVVLISDFLIDLAEVRQTLPLLGRDHEVHVIQVLDRKELNLDIEGDLRLHDAETRSIIRTFITGRLRSSYHEKLRTHVREIEKGCADFGYSFHLASTGQDIFDAFWEILEGKKGEVLL